MWGEKNLPDMKAFKIPQQLNSSAPGVSSVTDISAFYKPSIK